ncbi:MAG: ugpQ 2 [Verrucomicrobiales bacterium]|nr:ugpQ 2 [Verrucomicrobiales bacterium]
MQAISLDRGDRTRSAVAAAWISKLTKAIRREDQRHLITLGFLPNSAEASGGSGFPPREVARDLDFVSVHLYPKPGHLTEDLALLRQFAIGKPLVIEETYPMPASAADLKTFLEASIRIANGWIGFYWGKPPAELRESKQIGDHILLSWLTVFKELNHSNPPGKEK